MSNPQFDRVRHWARTLKLNDPVAQFLPMNEECKELYQALHGAAPEASLLDARGDVAVTAIVLFDAFVQRLRLIEDEVVPLPDTNLLEHHPAVMLGNIAEGLRKPKKAHLVPINCVWLLRFAQTCTPHDFERLCLGPVIEILEARLKEGYTYNAGTAVKAGDS